MGCPVAEHEDGRTQTEENQAVCLGAGAHRSVAIEASHAGQAHAGTESADHSASEGSVIEILAAVTPEKNLSRSTMDPRL